MTVTRRQRCARAGCAHDAGYATVATAGFILAIVSLLLVVVLAAQHVIARHRAQVAAGLSAVAGAYALAVGEDACGAAHRTAKLNRAGTLECTPEGTDVVVTAVVDGREASARAGQV